MPDDKILKEWFCNEVLPFEPSLKSFIRRHWKDGEEASDILHDVYEKALIGASRELPRRTAAYLVAIARNHIITLVKRSRIVSLDLVADLESLYVDADLLAPERHLTAREELRRVQAALERLPSRCREVIRLRKVEGLSIREVSVRLGVGIDAVEQQTTLGMRALADLLLGGDGRVRRHRYSGTLYTRKGRAREE